jgi:hypothetical protein
MEIDSIGKWEEGERENEASWPLVLNYLWKKALSTQRVHFHHPLGLHVLPQLPPPVVLLHHLNWHNHSEGKIEWKLQFADSVTGEEWTRMKFLYATMQIFPTEWMLKGEWQSASPETLSAVHSFSTFGPSIWREKGWKREKQGKKMRESCEGKLILTKNNFLRHRHEALRLLPKTVHWGRNEIGRDRGERGREELLNVREAQK